MEKVKIFDRETGGWEIVGEEIGHVSTKYGDPGDPSSEPRPRWGLNTVWALANGKYALYRASMSVIYHREDTSCRNAGPRGAGSGQLSGSSCLVRDMPEDAEPCRRCSPPWPDEMTPTTRVRFEFPRQSVVICDDAEMVIDRMTRYRKHSGEEMSGASGPARALLEQCRENDSEFAVAQPPMTKIS